jgi:hypothetical protein
LNSIRETQKRKRNERQLKYIEQKKLKTKNKTTTNEPSLSSTISTNDDQKRKSLNTKKVFDSTMFDNSISDFIPFKKYE